jgi:RNA 3'-terminal phosphate cyclase (ATP)
MITIDGSQGEGGGQILRSALALSLVTGRAFRITRIRAGRKNPGLMRQHLTAVTAAAAVGQAEVRGAELGSAELIFDPGAVRPGDYQFAVGTAGSATLVLQTLLPPLLKSDAVSRIVVEGGTHNMHAPPFDFLAKTFVPIVNRLGSSLEVTLTRPGFYPVGGGEVVATVTPGGEGGALELIERGACRGRRARALVARLPASIAERELRVVGQRLSWPAEHLHVEEISDSRGPGNVVMIELEYEHVTEVFTGFGARGVRAEAVAESAIDQAQRYLNSSAPVGGHLADQLLLPLALGRGGTFRATDLTEHTKTNIAVLRTFLDGGVETEREQAGTWRVTVSS